MFRCPIGQLGLFHRRKYLDRFDDAPKLAKTILDVTRRHWEVVVDDTTRGGPFYIEFSVDPQLNPISVINARQTMASRRQDFVRSHAANTALGVHEETWSQHCSIESAIVTVVAVAQAE